MTPAQAEVRQRYAELRKRRENADADFAEVNRRIVELEQQLRQGELQLDTDRNQLMAEMGTGQTVEAAAKLEANRIAGENLRRAYQTVRNELDRRRVALGVQCRDLAEASDRVKEEQELFPLGRQEDIERFAVMNDRREWSELRLQSLLTRPKLYQAAILADAQAEDAKVLEALQASYRAVVGDSDPDDGEPDQNQDQDEKPAEQ